MASTIDSGVDTGNDSNDSSVQEKLSNYKMDVSLRIDNNSEQQNSMDSGKETSSEEEHELQPQTSSAASKEDSPNPDLVSLAHLQPATLMHGYECRPLPTAADIADRRLNCDMLNAMNSKVGVFVSGGPFGTEYKQSELMNSIRRRRSIGHGCHRKFHRGWTVPWRSSFPSLHSSMNVCGTTNYMKMRDTMRMCRAACNNNTQAMREMLETGISPNCQDIYKRSPLHLAACMGYADMVKLLLEHGADPNAKDSIGNTPLHLAACTNHVNVITLLLKAGTRVTEKDLEGHSPLQLAITKFNIMKRSIMPHPVLKEQVCQVITMLTEYMRRKEGATIDPDLLNKFESLVRVSDSTEEVESNIRDLLTNLSSLSLSGPSS